jgi:hypothetical protein
MPNSKQINVPLSLKLNKKTRSSLRSGTAWRASVYMSTLGTSKTASISIGSLNPFMDCTATTPVKTIAALGRGAQPEREVMLPPGQAAKLSHCRCDPLWFCSPHDMCFIHESCFCEGSSCWPLVRLVCSDWVSFSCLWLADMIHHP